MTKLRLLFRVLTRSALALVIIGGILPFCNDSNAAVFNFGLSLIVGGFVLQVLSWPILFKICPPPKVETDEERVVRVQAKYAPHFSKMNELIIATGINSENGRLSLCINTVNEDAIQTLRFIMRNEIEGVSVTYKVAATGVVAAGESS